MNEHFLFTFPFPSPFPLSFSFFLFLFPFPSSFSFSLNNSTSIPTHPFIFLFFFPKKKLIKKNPPLSNHGGRNLDTSPPSLLILLDLHKNAPEIFDKLEVYIDSGIRRGTDILKALCLGAKAVGMGRSFLYAVNYGEEGVGGLVDSMFAKKLFTFFSFFPLFGKS